MDKNLKNALIIITVLVGVYYLVSPYENCVRDLKRELKRDLDESFMENADPKERADYVESWIKAECRK